MCDVHRQGRRNCRENAPKRSNVIDRCLLPTPDLMGATCASRLLLCMLQSMLKNSAREFLKDRSPVEALRKMRDSRHETGYDRQMWREIPGAHKPAALRALVPNLLSIVLPKGRLLVQN